MRVPVRAFNVTASSYLAGALALAAPPAAVIAADTPQATATHAAGPQSPPAGATQGQAGAKPGAKSTRPTRAGTRAELQSVRVQIERMRQQAARESRERDRLTAQLRTAELALEKTRDELEHINNQISDYSTRRSATAAAQAQQDRAIAGARLQLASALRAAYVLSRSSPLELWLNEHSPVAAARLLTYYRYFGRARAQRIEHLSAELRQLGGLQDELTQQQAQLATLKQTQEQTLQQLAQQRDQRQQVLQQLTAAERTHSQQLARLSGEQAEFERVLRGLGRTGLSRAPGSSEAQDLTTVFGRLRGQLLWPVNGQLTAAFGQQRASGLTWDGMVIATPRDSPVRAVSAGRVVYADWLPGLGLLVILDHGDGYLSLYGHNDRLFKAVGATVSAGDVISAAGDSGGRAEPELYFEIRRAGRPIDPRPWFKTAQPLPDPPFRDRRADLGPLSAPVGPTWGSFATRVLE